MAKRKTRTSSRNNSVSHPSAAAKTRAVSNSSPMDVELLERLVKLMSANDLNTVDLRDGGRRVVLKRGVPTPSVSASMYAQPQMAGPAVVSSHGSAATATGASSTPAAHDSEKDLVAIKSPMVGTYYAAASPDAPPLVSVGSRVDEETDVCIIEAMKVFNNIKAECRGTIAKVLVTNGQTVEFGQILFLVQPG